jgi:parallel beta-helix repeat protein
MFRRLLPTVVLLALAAPAAAQNGSTAGTLELYPTLQNVGLRLAYTGDANLNATARVEWRPQGETAWRAGVSLTRITGSRWAGSVFWLNPDTPYDVRAIIEDPDGGGSATGTVRTRTRFSATASGATYWVATNGSDGNAGTSAAPFATIQAALNAAQPGDMVRVRAGIYYQTFDTSRSGTAAAPIHVVADGPGVTLDGSDPVMLSRTDWRDDGGGIWSVPFTGTTRLVVVDSTMRLYKQTTLANLQANANGMTQGWAAEGGRLYVKPEGAVSPNGRAVHVARYDMAAYIDVAYVRVTGFEVRYYGTTTGAAGLTLRGASHCELIGNSIHSIGGKGIYLRVLASDNLVESNVCRDPRISGWPWSATKGHEEELQGISNRGGRGNVIRFNTVRGTFDGIDSGGDTSTEDIAADTDLDDNRIVSVADDGLETESFAGINMRVYRNWVEDPLNEMSIAPNLVGPTYVLFNTFHNSRKGGFKFSLDTVGETWIVHNTIASTRAGFGPVYPTGTWSNKHFRNNIMVGNGQPSIGDDAGESQTGNDFNGDLLHAVNYGSLVVWKGTAYATLAAFRTATGFEANGRSGDPLFTNAAAGDYTLRAGSPAIDGAIRLPGINDVFTGAAPDIGAYEFNNGLDVTPPAAIQDLSGD